MKNPIIQLYKHYKEYGLKKTLKVWKRNFLILQTPEKITNQRIIGAFGTGIGLMIILIVFIKKDMIYAVIAVGFGVFLQYVNLKQLLAQRQALRDMKNQYEEVEG